MAELPLSFPVFYHCVVKSKTNLKQYDAVSILLLGKLRNDCEEIVITDPVAANYVSGKKRIRNEILGPLITCSVAELKQRLQRLGIQDISQTVYALKRLLAIVSPLSDSTRRGLLDIGETAEDGYDFAASVFLAAIKSSAPAVPLSKEDKQAIRACYFEADPNPAPEDPEPEGAGPDADSAPVSQLRFERGFESINIRYRSVTREDYDETRVYMDRYLNIGCETDRLLGMEEEDYLAFWAQADEDVHMIIVELSGQVQDIRRLLLCSDVMCGVTAAIMNFEAALDVGLEELEQVLTAIDRVADPNIWKMFSLGFHEGFEAGYIEAMLFVQKKPEQETRTEAAGDGSAGTPDPSREKGEEEAELLTGNDTFEAIEKIFSRPENKSGMRIGYVPLKDFAQIITRPEAEAGEHGEADPMEDIFEEIAEIFKQRDEKKK